MNDVSKKNKFERIAQKRVTEALKRIRLLGNLSDKRYYSYTDSHIHEMFNAIESEIRAIKSRFRSESGDVISEFMFNKAKK